MSFRNYQNIQLVFTQFPSSLPGGSHVLSSRLGALHMLNDLMLTITIIPILWLKKLRLSV